jgi:hypothetical protein
MADFLRQNWGNLASVVGLSVSVWVLIVAQKAREAAEEARALARLKVLVEELDEASSKIQQLGIFLREQKWDLVQLRIEEILGSCKSVLARWGDHLIGDSRNNLLKASNITRSIALVAGKSSVRQLTEAERLRMSSGQIRAAELISTALGEARKVEERRHGKP